MIPVCDERIAAGAPALYACVYITVSPCVCDDAFTMEKKAQVKNNFLGVSEP